MRPEISNELLLQIIQAWDPTEADAWSVYGGGLMWGVYLLRGKTGFIRGESKGALNCHDYAIWDKARKLVGFLLQDRLKVWGTWNREVIDKCYEDFGTSWAADPFGGAGAEPSAETIVSRLKSYEYLKAWKELPNDATDMPTLIDPSDVELSICGQAIEGMEIHDDVLKVPGTYEQLCPHCNGSKEVTGWHGKETCNVCR